MAANSDPPFESTASKDADFPPVLNSDNSY